MSMIKNLMIDEKIIEVEFPDSDGFFVKLSYVGRDKLMKIRNRALVFKFNKRTRQREEEVDNERFLEAYSEKAIAGWKGLKAKHLPVLLPVDISAMDANEEIEYSSEDAMELLKNSTIFDQFITDCMNDFEQFSKKKAEDNSKN